MRGSNVLWLCRIALARPRTTVAVAFLAVIAMAPGLPRLHLRTDGHALLPQYEPGIVTDNRIRADFGLRDQFVVLFRSHHVDGIFNSHTLGLIRRLHDELLGLPGVDADHLTSLVNEKNDRVTPGTLNFRSFLDVVPETAEEIARLRDDLRKFGIYHGTLIARDEKSSCILLGVRDGLDRQGMFAAIRELAAKSQPSPDEIAVVGAPVAESLLGTHILEDLGVPSAWMGAGSSTETPVTGFPATAYEFRRWIAQTVGLVPLAVALMALVFLAMFRRIAAAGLPLMEVGACLVFTFGLMGWLGVPVYLTIAVMPIILCASGITDEIHVFNRYRQIAAERPSADGAEIAGEAIAEMWRPVVKTSVTTAVGFLSFGLSDLQPVQAFGIFSSIGVLFCMVWSLSVVPAMLTILPRGMLIRERAAPRMVVASGIEARFAALAELFLRRRGLVLLAAGVILIVSPWGIARLKVQDSWIEGFSPESEFRRATGHVNDGFFGTHLLTMEVSAPHEELRGELEPAAISMFEVRLPTGAVVDVDRLAGRFIEIRATIERSAAPATTQPGSPQLNFPTEFTRLAEIESARREGELIILKTRREYGPLNFRPGGTDKIRVAYTISPRPMSQPSTLNLICELDEFVRAKTDCAVGGVLGPCEYLATLNYSSLARREEERRIPGSAQRVCWLWEQYERLRGRERLGQLVDATGSRCLITIFLNDANYIRTAQLIDAIRAFEHERLAPRGLSIAFGGDVAASQTLIQSIVQTQVTSVLGSLVGIFVLTAILSRSLVWGLIAVIPCSLAVAVNFAVMGWLGIPIGVATSMFASMTLGVGVDHAIHLIERFRADRTAGMASHEAAVRSFALNGPAILTDALAICLGFGVMILSQVPSNARLGLLVVVCDIACVVGTLLLVPAIMARRRA